MSKTELRELRAEVEAIGRRLDEILEEIDDLIYGGTDHDGTE